MESCVALFVLMVDEELAIDLSQKGILEQFLQDRHYETASIMLYCKDQASVTIVVKPFSILQA